MNRVRTVSTLMLCIALSACMSAGQHREAVRDDGTDRVTVGIVQKEIRVGMSGAEVIGVLGSPNIVSTDAERREVWVYDKIATEYVYSSDGGGVGAFILGFDSDVLSGAEGGPGEGGMRGFPRDR